ncbi:MAG: ADP-ribosylation/crystallin J1 [Anaerolineae bacterium]|nr:ADP-ribosylation/crystallin J1 [Anaerolineae bacterium]
METRILYRPVGLFELQLIRASDYTVFPPRLPEQPLFYPVLNFEYAEQIARDWNTRDKKSGYMGAVIRFTMPKSYLDQFQEQVVGGSVHRELWVPAEELENFNQQIIGIIEIAAAYYGEQFNGEREW